MLTNDELVAQAGSLRDTALALMEKHEAEAHAGEPCGGNRASLIAYLVHCLGVDNPGGFFAIALYAEEYREKCHQCKHGRRRA